jgi:ABC-type nitrate/sulfonate/bicarbonate transport system permease component
MQVRMRDSFVQRIGKSRYVGVGFLLLLLLSWEASVRSGWIQAFGLPAFSRVAQAFWSFLWSGEAFSVLVPSLKRWAVGYALAILLGVSLGMLMGYFAFFYRLLEPVMELLRPIPSPAYVPIAILFLGIDDAMKIFVIVFASFWAPMINTYAGVRGIDSVQINTARTLGVPRGIAILHVVLPAAAPYIFAGMRVSLAVSLILTVISEMIAGNSGIGYFILLAQRTFEIEAMYAGIAALAFVGYGLNAVFVAIEKRVLTWHFATSERESR